MNLIIDNSKIIDHSRRLEKIRKTAYPQAIGMTLNNQAFYARNKAIKEFPKKFTSRRAGMQKAITQVEKNSEKNKVNSMKSTMGYVKHSNKGLAKIAERMKAQEYGGSLSAYSIPTTFARGNNAKKRVSPKFRNIDANKIVKGAFKMPGGGTSRSKLVAQAYVAWKKKKFIQTKTGIFEVKNFRKNSDGKIRFDKNMIFSTKENREIRVNERPVIRSAAIAAGKKGYAFFDKNANYIIQKSK
jgi:hypothetical protein